MWTRSAKDKVTGLMTVVCTDWDGNVFFEGQFADFFAAEEAGKNAERQMTMAMQAKKDGTPTLAEILAEMDELDSDIMAMSDDELLAELGV